jgi:hypothetical protein
MRVGVAALALLVAGLVSCGGDSDDAGGGAESARHLDPRSDAVVAVDLDYDGSNWEQVKRLYARVIESGAVSEGDGGGFVPPTLDGALGAAASFAGLSFAEDVRPLLGGTLYVGVRVEPAEPLSPETRDLLERLDEDATDFGRSGARYYDRDGRPLDTEAVDDALTEEAAREAEMTATVVYRVEDPEALDRVVEKLRGQGLRPQPVPGVEDAESLTDGVAVVSGDTIVAIVSDDTENADRLLRDRLAAGDAGAPVPQLDGDLVAVRAAPSLLGAVLDREQLRRALATHAGGALRGAEAGLRLEEDAARADARVDFEGLPNTELPLPAAGTLELPPEEPVASASADQNFTTVFLARLARELYPESRFVRRVEALEREQELRFEDEVLRQFAGPSFTVLRPLGDDSGDVAFGARSTLRDPVAMRELLPRLAPALPGILEALQGLGSTGLTGLLFIAPDAPLTPSAFALLAAVRVSRLAGGPDELLYEVTGLDESGFRPGPNRVVYGMVGDEFVVASSPELAREVAAMPTEPAPEAGTRLRVDAAEVVGDLIDAFGVDEDARIARALLDRAEASASAEGGDITADAEIVWTR